MRTTYMEIMDKLINQENRISALEDRQKVDNYENFKPIKSSLVSDDLKEQYYRKTGEEALNGNGKPFIAYMNWLESELRLSRQKKIKIKE